MSTKIEEILEELYLIDPALRSEEAALKKTIEDLMKSRPDGRMDERFEAELKEKLIAEFSKKAEPKRRKAAFLFARSGFRIGLGAAAAAAVLLAVFVGRGLPAFGPGAKPPLTEPGAAAVVNQQPAQDPAKPASGAPALGAKIPGPKAPATTGAAATVPSAGDDATGKGAPAPDGTLEKYDDTRLSAHPKALASRSQAETEENAPAELRRETAGGAAAQKQEAAAPAGSRAVRPAPSVVPAAPRPLGGQAATGSVAKDKKAAAGPGSAVADLDEDQFAAQAATTAEAPADLLADRNRQDFNTEGYDRVVENSFAKVIEEPLSTFSIDVDTASYANVRRFLRSGSLPPPDAVRIEELVNYFPYDYEGPSNGEPFAFDTELSPCPWNDAHQLLRVALQAKRIKDSEIPPCNLVFLIDVSGSMEDENKLPLVKEALKALVRRMRQQDRISLVVYAGSAGVVLEPTSGSRTDKILKAIDELESGGSTAGGEGIRLAYAAAKKAFIPKGSNRVILATDGDFNIGASSDGELVRIIEEERKAGVFLTVLGFGMGNYKDSKMQKLADSGNGNYAYIDTISEADKVLSKQMAGTIFTVAKDVKVQIEFNPARVGEYRLVGYEKRALAARDFADDSKDAGELGAGSSVTALYELVPPVGATARTDLKYQSTKITAQGSASKELMTLKFRYKKPDGAASSLVERPVTIEPRALSKTSADFRFAAAVAEWGQILRGSAYKGSASLDQVASLARGALGRDSDGYRTEFLELVGLSKRLGR
jgi:Ca-activated chloride channel family protein